MTPRLTFTFDNGPCPGATDRLLDFLAKRSVKATFFVVGEQIRDPAARAVAERARAEGHWIGNHTLTHGAPLGRDGGIERVEREIGETQRLLGPLSHERKFFRPNGGGASGPHLLSAEALRYLVRHKFTVVTWNSVPGDWIAPHENWFDKAVMDLDAQEWTVLVLHDEYIAGMLDTLARFCDELVRRNIEVVQDFPASCLPVVDGAARDFVRDYTTDAAEAV